MAGRYQDALATLDEAEEELLGDPDLALNRGIIFLKMGDVAKALTGLRAYRSAPSVKKPSPVYYAYTVLAAAIAGQLDYAVAVGREGLGHYPDSGPILVNTGAVLERRGDMDSAGAYYGRAVSASPVPAQAHKNLGDHAYAHGDIEAARIHYEKAVRINPRLGDDVYLRLGTIAHQGRGPRRGPPSLAPGARAESPERPGAHELGDARIARLNDRSAPSAFSSRLWARTAGPRSLRRSSAGGAARRSPGSVLERPSRARESSSDSPTITTFSPKRSCGFSRSKRPFLDCRLTFPPRSRPSWHRTRPRSSVLPAAARRSGARRWPFRRGECSCCRSTLRLAR